MLARVACLLLAAFPLLASACQATPVAELRGSGHGPSDLIALAAGSYRIDWSGSDDDPPKDGCLLGLALELADREPEPFDGTILRRIPSKITYRPVPAGASVAGGTIWTSLVDGLYRVRAEGSCTWRVRLTSIPPP